MAVAEDIVPGLLPGPASVGSGLQYLAASAGAAMGRELSRRRITADSRSGSQAMLFSGSSVWAQVRQTLGLPCDEMCTHRPSLFRLRPLDLGPWRRPRGDPAAGGRSLPRPISSRRGPRRSRRTPGSPGQ